MTTEFTVTCQSILKINQIFEQRIFLHRNISLKVIFGVNTHQLDVLVQLAAGSSWDYLPP
jgi:hypothetical protein